MKFVIFLYLDGYQLTVSWLFLSQIWQNYCPWNFICSSKEASSCTGIVCYTTSCVLTSTTHGLSPMAKHVLFFLKKLNKEAIKIQRHTWHPIPIFPTQCFGGDKSFTDQKHWEKPHEGDVSALGTLVGDLLVKRRQQSRDIGAISWMHHDLIFFHSPALTKSTCSQILLKCLDRKTMRVTVGAGDFPGGWGIKNPPCDAEDTGSVPDQGTKIPHAAEQLTACSATTEPTPQLETHKERSHMTQQRSFAL